MELSVGLHQPPHEYFTGLASTGDSIGGEVAALADRWYVLDLASDRYRVVSIPAIRPQADTTERPGESTLSVEGLWRRTGSSWDHGAGQEWYDRNEADPRRFFASRGINVWTEWEMSLLPDVTTRDTNAGGYTSLAIGRAVDAPPLPGVPALYAGKADTGVEVYNSTGTSIATTAGLTGPCYVASTGRTVYVGDSTGVHEINVAGTGVTAFNTNVTNVDGLWFAKARLFASKGAELWDLVDGTTAAPFHTHPWPGWRWSSVTEGQQAVFAAGHSGDRGLIYALAIAEDGTGLEPPVVAVELPDGEIPLSLASYVGFMLIGTNKGLRLATQNGTALTIGALVGGGPVRCLEPQEEFCWFGWDTMFTDASGLGRVDLSKFVEALAPPFATDLDAKILGNVTAVVTFEGKLWFTVGTTLFSEDETLVESGQLETGLITFSIHDEKTAIYVDLRHDPLVAGDAIEVESKTSLQPYDFRGTSNAPNTDRPVSVISMNASASVAHGLRVTLKRAVSSPAGPKLTAIVLAAQPRPDRTVSIYLPLLIHETVTYADQDYSMDCADEIRYLRDLVTSQRLVRFQQGQDRATVFVEDFEWIPDKPTSDGQALQGTMVLKLKSAQVAR